MGDRLRSVVTFPRRHPAWTLVAALLVGVFGFWLWRDLRSRWVLAERTRAEEALAAQDFDAARRHLDRCSLYRPDDPTLALLSAQAARRAEKYPEAEEHLRRYQALVGAATKEGTLELAMLLAQRGDSSQSESHLLSCLAAHDPATDLILEALALSYVTTYRLVEALDMLHQLLARQPDHITALLTRGILYESATHKDKALKDYRQAVEARPDNSRALLRLAEALQGSQKLQEAIPYYERLLARDPTHAEALLGLAGCRRDTGDVDAAALLLDELAVAHPDYEAGILERGRLALQRGRLEEAERLLRRAVELRPADYLAHHHLSLCLQAQGKQSESRTHRDRADQIDRDRKQLFRLYPKAMSSAQDPAPRLELSRICLRNGQEKEALRWLMGALQIAPDHRPTHQALADYYQERGDTERAEYHRRRARTP